VAIPYGNINLDSTARKWLICYDSRGLLTGLGIQCNPQHESYIVLLQSPDEGSDSPFDCEDHIQEQADWSVQDVVVA
jgi:hypothetical protein